MNTDKILVVGASGLVGSEVVKILKKQNAKVRATTSKAVANSDELVHLDLVTGEGIKEAFEGIDRAFFLSPPGHADQHALLAPLIQEAKRRGLKKVVLMTAMGANAVETSPFRRAEIELEKSGLNYNIVRPNWFLQNFNSFWLQGIQQQNKILLPAGTAKVSFIDARDISAVVANLLISDTHNNKDFDLTGGEPASHSEIAALLSKVSGRTIEYKEIAPAEMKQGLLQAGFPEGYVDFMILIFGFLKEGYNARLTTSVRDITGANPRSLAEYANDFKQAWMK